MFFHPAFVLFLLALFAIYWAAPVKARRVVMIAGSVGVYTAIVSFQAFGILAVIFIAAYLTQAQNKPIKIVGTLVVLLPLFICKYIPQIIPDWPSIIGISFFTFTAIARIWGSPERYCLIHTASALFFFPIIFSGPILSKGILAEPTDKPLFEENLWRIALGMFMKLVLAGWAGKASAGALTQLDGMGTLQWHGLLLTYGAQIYWDFAGYTYMAIGFAGLFGFAVGENFNAPYLAKDLQQFWRRWHISLATWLREHIYIPLGGNRKGLAVQMAALMTVMLVCGIWHGNTWAFFLWGLWHGLGLVFLSLTKEKWNISTRWPWLAGGLTLYFVIWGWVPFFLTDWASLFQTMPWMQNDVNSHGIQWLLIGLVFMGACIALMKQEQSLIAQAAKLPIALQSLGLLLAWIVILWISPWGIPDFIYFKF